MLNQQIKTHAPGKKTRRHGNQKKLEPRHPFLTPTHPMLAGHTTNRRHNPVVPANPNPVNWVVVNENQCRIFCIRSR